MHTQLALCFRDELNAVHTALLALSSELADTPWREGGWTRKQISAYPSLEPVFGSRRSSR
jgi:hypothetical protein